MLIIRDAQMDALQAQQYARFARQLAEHVRRNEPELVAEWPDGLLERRVAYAHECARTYGIDDALAVAEFFAAMVIHTPAFDAHPEIHALLRDEAAAPDHRIYAVWQRTTPETWAQARAFGRARSWPCDDEGLPW